MQFSRLWSLGPCKTWVGLYHKFVSKTAHLINVNTVMWRQPLSLYMVRCGMWTFPHKGQVSASYRSPSYVHFCLTVTAGYDIKVKSGDIS